MAIRQLQYRDALNEALHELRRPLQALALSVPGGPQGAQAVGEGAGSGGWPADLPPCRQKKTAASRQIKLTQSHSHDRRRI